MKRSSAFAYGVLSLVMAGSAIITSAGGAGAASPAGVWQSSMLVPGVSALNTGQGAGVTTLSCTAPGDCSAGGSAGSEPFVVDEKNGVWGTAREVPGVASLGGGEQSAYVVTLSCASPGNCGAGGFYYTDSSGQTQAFVVSETNGTWGAAQEVPGTGSLNTEGAAQVSSISCASPGNCAVGGYYSVLLSGIIQEVAFVADDKDGTWDMAQEVPGTAALTGNGHSEVTSVSCSSAGDCVAGGSAALSAFVSAETGGIWGTAQTISGLTALPGGEGQVNSVSCNAPGYCSAVGQTGAFVGEGFGVTETNGTWGTAAALPVPATVPSGDTAAEQPESVSCASPGNCAAGGFYAISADPVGNSLEQGGFLADEVNGTWSAPEQVPGLGTETGMVDSVSCPAVGYCTAAGTLTEDYATQSAVMTETNGTWGPAQAALGSGSAGVVAGVGGLSCAAVGYCSVGGDYSDDYGQDLQAVVQDETPVLPTTTTVSLSAAKVTYGHEQAEKLSVAVAAKLGVPGGTVTVKSGSAGVCTVTLASGKGSCTVPAAEFTSGTVKVTASYDGATGFASSSAGESFTVTKAASKASLSLSATRVTYGHEQAEKLSVAVSPQYSGTPSGQVTIKTGSTDVCTISLKSGKGTCTLSATKLKTGSHQLIADYAGSSGFNGSASASKTLTIAK